MISPRPGMYGSVADAAGAPGASAAGGAGGGLQADTKTRPDVTAIAITMERGINSRMKPPLADVSLPARSQINPAQAERVADDRYRTERHGCARDDRAEQQPDGGIQHACRDRHAEHVIDKREEQILPDILHRRPAEA